MGGYRKSYAWRLRILSGWQIKKSRGKSGNRIGVLRIDGKRCEICFGNTAPERVASQNASPLTLFGLRRSQARTVNAIFICLRGIIKASVLLPFNPLLVGEKRFHILKKEAKIFITNSEFILIIRLKTLKILLYGKEKTIDRR